MIVKNKLGFFKNCFSIILVIFFVMVYFLNTNKYHFIAHYIQRLAFMEIFRQFDINDIHVVCERPMINPTRWKASMSAIRCWEAQLIILEVLGVPHQFVDSKEWQRELLPKGIKGSDEQKKASKDIGKRLFPSLADFKHTDFDGLLIAEYARRKNL